VRRTNWGKEQIRAYQVHLFQERKLGVRTVGLHTAALRFFFCKTLKRMYPVEEAPYPRAPRRLPIILTREEAVRMIDSASNFFHRAMLITLYSTGMRRAELCNFKVEDIDHPHDHPYSAGQTLLNLPIGIKAVTSLAFGEPGVFGVRRPVLLLPEGVTDRLTASQFEAILAHEICHLGHSDNFVSAIHMFVEAVFWFHPLVWWIGARLMDERERACDEVVRKATRRRSMPKEFSESASFLRTRRCSAWPG
jgi:hypothetical protein